MSAEYESSRPDVRATRGSSVILRTVLESGTEPLTAPMLVSLGSEGRT